MGSINDENDPICHDVGGLNDKAIRQMIARFNEWAKRQDPDTQARFCEHGSYVGFQRALAYRCRLCPEV